MGENVCCPHLKIVKCHDTEDHKHLFCDYENTVERMMIDNDWVKVFCIGRFEECKYFPKMG